ncbi:MAG: hypothetical protein IJC39_05335 [Firmicutes bacterium]|nr:hypothetical protein [Bacillota bacterium]
MFDIWAKDINISVLIFIIAFAVFLPVQLLLCFRAKKRIARMLPVIILAVIILILLLLAALASGWDGLGYIFLAIFAGFMLFACGIGWAIWGIVNLIKKKKAADSLNQNISNKKSGE